MEKPICLIEKKVNEPLKINQEALQLLLDIQQPVVVVAIVGLYRTGKSYLMNKLAGKNKGFSLGTTIQANTMGIWMWCLPHPQKRDHTLVLLDSEGLGDVEKSNTENDTWIFALSVLLSSTLVYNSMGTIDQGALEKLQYVTELTKCIKVKATPTENSKKDASDDFLRFFPAFIWAVRDFSLDLELNGHPISTDEYLENALRLKKDSPEKLDLAKKCIRQYFPSRKCFVFDRPTQRKELKNLENLSESKLSPDFVEEVDIFLQYIYKNAEAKVIQGGHAVTGTLLGNLAVSYVDSIRSGTVPCIENAVLVLAEIENSAAVQEAIKYYEDRKERLLKLPTETVEELLQAHSQCEKEAIKVFMARSFNDEGQEYQKQLGMMLESKLRDLCSCNERASLDRCQTLIKQLFQDLEEKIASGIYAVPGGYQQFLKDQKEQLEKYHQAPGKGLMASRARQDYLKSQETAAQSILKADYNLTQKEKEAEVERVRAQAAEREAELQRKLREETLKMAEEKEKTVIGQDGGGQEESTTRGRKDVEYEAAVERVRAQAAGQEAELQRKLREEILKMVEEKEKSYEEHERQLLANMEEDRKNQQLEDKRMLSMKLQMMLESKLRDLCCCNTQASLDHRQALLTQLFQDLEKKIASGIYAGCQQFLNDWEEQLEKYQRAPGKGLKVLPFPSMATPAQPKTMEKPICLIENKLNEPLKINQKALQLLQDIQQPVVVVAIVGLYRTGKSYLMNKLAGKNKGFSLGTTIQANTTGIWMWCLPHPEKRDHTLVLLDTEGLGDVEKSNTENDTWIFALSVLLSSTLVYNSMGTIDQGALEKLQYVTELTKCIRVKATPTENSKKDASDDFLRFFPAFIWAVRDFRLGLEHNGHPISTDEYLEIALRRKKDNPEKLELAKKCICQYFPSRKCFVFDHPAITREELKNLENLSESKLLPSFVKEVDIFRQYIYKNAEAKVIQGGHVVTGTLLGNLAVSYVDSIRSGTVPCIENAVLALAQIENSAAVQEAIKHYEDRKERLLKLPTETVEELLQAHSRCEKEAIKVFMARSFNDEGQEYQKQLGMKLESKLKDLCSRNTQASLDRCQALLTQLFQDLEMKIASGIYAVPGGYQHFLKDQKEQLEKYHRAPGKGLMASRALQDYLKYQEAAAQSILKADRNLTQKEKEAEVERVRAQAAEREAALQKKLKEEALKMVEEKEKSFEEHERQLLAKMEEDRKNQQLEYERMLSIKLQEVKHLREEGRRAEAARMQDEIKQLETEMKEMKEKKMSCVIC